MSNLEHAIALASKAHSGQRDKAGQPYILHPLKLMAKFDQEALRIVSVLHDVVEDSATTFDDLRALGFSDEIVTAVECLTKRQGESYMDFIARVAQNPLARTVKLEDIKDNLDVTRLVAPLGELDLQRVKKYHDAYLYLTQ